jgi:hypothetical protein
LYGTFEFATRIESLELLDCVIQMLPLQFVSILKKSASSRRHSVVVGVATRGKTKSKREEEEYKSLFLRGPFFSK